MLFGPDCPPQNKILEAFLDRTEPKYCTIDHDRPLIPQLMALPAVGPSNSVAPPSADLSTGAVVAPVPAPAPEASTSTSTTSVPGAKPAPNPNEPPPLPSDEELENGKPASPSQEPSGLE